jgi:ectoine hydroxylase-related dioxygenase (phytanoyl-CoA dioxygenase family)
MNLENLKNEYNTNGHCIIKNFFSQDDINNILNDLESLTDDECVRYLDDNSQLRRVEEVAYKKEHLSGANDKILEIIEKVFQTKMILFKDKYNVKPPKGEGFYAHYDGIFIWEDENGNKRNGWHEYAEEFFNVLIAIDKCDEGNGTLEVAKEIHSELTFEEMLNNTLKNGTPELSSEVQDKLTFHKVDLEPGDIVFFSNRCPHQSQTNPSETRSRKILYYTYNKASDGDNYQQYFDDKRTSNKNSTTSKALSYRKEEK